MNPITFFGVLSIIVLIMMAGSIIVDIIYKKRYNKKVKREIIYNRQVNANLRNNAAPEGMYEWEVAPRLQNLEPVEEDIEINPNVDGVENIFINPDENGDA